MSCNATCALRQKPIRRRWCPRSFVDALVVCAICIVGDIATSFYRLKASGGMKTTFICAPVQKLCMPSDMRQAGKTGLCSPCIWFASLPMYFNIGYQWYLAMMQAFKGWMCDLSNPHNKSFLGLV